MTAKTAALLLGAVFLLVGIAGLVPNPVGPDGIFATNPMHDYIHIGSGALLVLAGLSPMASVGLIAVGIAYGVVAVLGVAMGGDMLFGIVRLNNADRYFHAGLAVLILISGFLLPQSAPARETPASQGQGVKTP